MNSITFKNELVGAQEESCVRIQVDRRPRGTNDLLQETSLKALDNEDKYTPETNFKGWIYTIMRNIFINNYRRVVREQTFVDQTENLYHLSTPQQTRPKTIPRVPTT